MGKAELDEFDIVLNRDADEYVSYIPVELIEVYGFSCEDDLVCFF